MKTETHEQCTVCFEILDSSEQTTLSDDILKLLKLLITKLNITLLQNSPICETCLGKIKSACKFKTSYLELHDAFPNIKVEDDAYSEKPVICEMCKSTVNTCDAIPLFDPVNQTNKLMLINHLSPELESRIPEELQTCESCHKSMVNFCSITNLLSVFDQDIVSDESEYQSTSIKKEPKDIDSIPSSSALVFPESSGTSIKKEIKTAKEDIDEDDDEDEEKGASYQEFIAKNEELDLKMDCDEEAGTDRLSAKNGKQSTNSLFDQIGGNSIKHAKNFICHVCQFKTTTKKNLKRHLLIHMKSDDKELYECAMCDYKTAIKMYLRRHMTVHRNLDEDMFKCELCEYKTRWKRTIKRHMLTHKQATQFRCELCDYKTKSTMYLNRHMLCHKQPDEIQMFQCAFCEYKTRRKRTIKTHILLHKRPDELEMFQCEICDYKAKIKSYLKNHMLIHKERHDTDMLQCNMCKFTTITKVYLKRHMLVHKKPNEMEMFRCDMCPFETKRKYDLKIHKSRKHENS